MERIAEHTRRLLDERGWSYREQEAHTGVTASVVYDITLTRAVHRDWLRQFASVARGLARGEEARGFWEFLTVRLTDPSLPNVIGPENAHLLWEAPGAADAGEAEAEAEEVLRLFRSLRRPESRRAARRLLEGLSEAERSRQPAAVSYSSMPA